ncbi:MAG: CYTH domain-containing protein [Lentisphaeria bacterium]|nr:CYTH domain-containing protein [Lentisphaeria bacterium]
MKLEIERKFLVEAAVWEGADFPSAEIRQGYFCRGEDYSLRVRIQDARALLTIKGKPDGITRKEFEYEIPLADAEEMLREFCCDRIIEKTRYYIPWKGFTWEVDQYYGANQGLITAEIELPDEQTQFDRPGWLGREVSQDLRYSNESLATNPLPERSKKQS